MIDTSTPAYATPSRAGARETAREMTRLYAQRALTAGAATFLRDPAAILFTRKGRRDPYAHYERIRSLGPMPASRFGLWLVTGHTAAKEVLRSRHFGVSSSVDGAPTEAVDLSLLQLDPPDHTRLRRLVAPAFSPRRLKEFDALVAETVTDLVRGLPRGEAFDLVDRIASPLPVRVITHLLGVPEDDHERFRRHGAAIAQVLDGFSSAAHYRRVRAAEADLADLFTRLFAERRADPRDDVITDLASAPEDTISPHEMVTLCQLLLIAGFETTVNLISSTVLNLRRAGQWDLVTADPSLADAAIEETLRFDPPVQLTGRYAITDTEVAGIPVPAGRVVLPLIGATGRDPEVFANPGVYDLTRTPEADHLAFSAGVHYCLGAPLARLEARVAVEALARDLPTLRPAGRVRHRATTTLRGPLHLPVIA